MLAGLFLNLNCLLNLEEAGSIRKIKDSSLGTTNGIAVLFSSPWVRTEMLQERGSLVGVPVPEEMPPMASPPW